MGESIDELLAATLRLADADPVVPRPALARAAFLDLTEPDLDTVAARLSETGNCTAVVVPLLYTEAYHAQVDTPSAVQRASSGSAVSLLAADILGTGDDLVGVLVEAADAAGVPAGVPLLLFSVGSSSGSANDAVTDLGRRLAARRSTQVRIAFATRHPYGRSVLAELPVGSAVLPLFTSPGLLLDPMQAAAEAFGAPLVPPLGARLAPLVLARYAAVLGKR